MGKRTPVSIADVKRQLFKKTWKWIVRRPIWARALLTLLILVILIGLARLELLGERAYRYARILLPGQVDMVDPAVVVVPLAMDFEVEDSMGRRPGKLGQTLLSGDRLHLTFSAGRMAWVTLFAVDSVGIHPVFQGRLAPSFVEQDRAYTLSFELDDTIGPEVYYLLASGEEFDFSHEVRPQLDLVFPEGRIKGPSFSPYELELPARFSQDMFFFEHAARPASGDGSIY
jgi:hypothetical protein